MLWDEGQLFWMQEQSTRAVESRSTDFRSSSHSRKRVANSKALQRSPGTYELSECRGWTWCARTLSDLYTLGLPISYHVYCDHRSMRVRLERRRTPLTTYPQPPLESTAPADFWYEIDRHHDNIPYRFPHCQLIS